MRRCLFVFVCSIVGMVTLADSTVGYIILNVPSPSLPDHMAMADIVFVGKVLEIEGKDASALPFSGAKKRSEFKVAVVEIQEGILGTKDVQKVRVGWVPSSPIKGAHVDSPPVQLEVGQEGLFMLPKHFEADFYLAPSQIVGINQEEGDQRGPSITFRSPVIPKKSATFAKNVEVARHCAKLMANPDESLKAKEADERFRTACLLIARYRNDRGQAFIAEIKANRRMPAGVLNQLALESPRVKTEPIEAAQSKLILEALAGADWTKPDRIIHVLPQMYFLRLDRTTAEGWTRDDLSGNLELLLSGSLRVDEKLARPAKEWCRNNASTYRIMRFVPAAASK
jgi:hypothetical protein